MGRHDARYCPVNVRSLTSLLHHTGTCVTIGDINLHGGKTMAAAKKSVETIREELRVLNAAVNEAAADAAKESWLTPEFWTMAGAALTNLVTVAVLVGWVDRSNADALMTAVSALIGASQVIVINTALVWKFIANRTQAKAQVAEARYRYMEAIAVEKFRAERSF